MDGLTRRPRDACALAECVVPEEEARSRRLFSPSTELPSWLANCHPTPITLNDIPLFILYEDIFRFCPILGHFQLHRESLLSHEPIWSVYLSDSRAYWRRLEPGPSAATNLAFANPIYFLLAITLVMLGAWKGWLNSRETLLAALLIFIPYIMRGHEMCMLSQGRFMAVVFPIYLVMGQVLSRIPSPYAAMVVGLFVFYLAIYSMHVAAGYPLI